MNLHVPQCIKALFNAQASQFLSPNSFSYWQPLETITILQCTKKSWEIRTDWNPDDIYLLGDRPSCTAKDDRFSFCLPPWTDERFTWVLHIFLLPVNLCKSCFHFIIFAGFIKLKILKSYNQAVLSEIPCEPHPSIKVSR